MAKSDCVGCIHSVVCKYRSRNEQPWIKEHCKLAAREERPHGKWIPVEERLPEKDGWYFGSKVLEGVRTQNIFWYEDGAFSTLGKVEAWMELPKPYRKAGE